MERKSAKHDKQNNYEIPGNWLNIEYFEALNMLFRIENALRVFVYIVLKNQYKSKRRDLHIVNDNKEQLTIGQIAKKRVAQDKDYAYLGYIISSPLLYLTSGELINIIKTHRKLFNRYFPGKKEIIEQKLNEIGNIRNGLAHFRPIKKGDLELIKQNSIHTLTEINKTIEEIIKCSDIVPTNTNSERYKNLILLNNEECTISFNQSKDGEWLKLNMNFNLPILSIKESYSKDRYYSRLMNIRIVPLLNKYEQILNQCIYVDEYVPYIFTKDPAQKEVRKIIKFTFSRVSMENEYKVITEQIKSITNQIFEEIDLIKNDNLARGEIIESINCDRNTLGEKKENEDTYYRIDKGSLYSTLDHSAPVEFWGTVENISSKDFITSTEYYPWIPIHISDDKALPF